MSGIKNKGSRLITFPKESCQDHCGHGHNLIHPLRRKEKVPLREVR